jgi:hypothetical protein
LLHSLCWVSLLAFFPLFVSLKQVSFFHPSPSVAIFCSPTHLPLPLALSLWCPSLPFGQPPSWLGGWSIHLGRRSSLPARVSSSDDRLVFSHLPLTGFPSVDQLALAIRSFASARPERLRLTETWRRINESRASSRGIARLADPPPTQLGAYTSPGFVGKSSSLLPLHCIAPKGSVRPKKAASSSASGACVAGRPSVGFLSGRHAPAISFPRSIYQLPCHYESHQRH